jgi:AcrR family transcriptional regulator
MSFRRLDNIDEKIIAATIQVGSTNGANKLSTKEIAKACGISEFVIYDHFQTKDNLVSTVDRYVFDKINEECSSFNSKSTTFEEFWGHMLDYLILHSDYNAFAINYSHIFPRVDKYPDYEDFVASVIVPLVEKNPYFLSTHIQNQERAVLLYMSMMRSIINFAQFIINGTLKDSPELRKDSYNATAIGLLSFAKK